ncbi:MAG: 4-vinyl reductase [Chloroflexi bacterium]|nr:4-vinyl reductase [Chloroflexota bacterium]
MNPSAYFYPPKMGRIILLSLEEVIGKSGVGAVLSLVNSNELKTNLPSAAYERAFSFEAISQLHQALEQAYGPRGGRGLALRTGRACFKYGLKEYGSLLGLSEIAFRLLPLPTKLRTGVRSFADLFNKQTDQRVHIEETETFIYWHIERCPLCWQRQADGPVCQLVVGLLQEALYWLSGGKIFSVEETSCIACGDAECIISIQKIPLT